MHIFRSITDRHSITVFKCVFTTDNWSDYASYIESDAGQQRFISCMANNYQGTACAHGQYHFMAENWPCVRTVNIIIVLENQIQALSRTFRHRFKDFQGPCLFLRTFQALKIWKKFKDIQGPARALSTDWHTCLDMGIKSPSWSTWSIGCCLSPFL